RPYPPRPSPEGRRDSARRGRSSRRSSSSACALDLTHEKPALSGRPPKVDVDARRGRGFDGPWLHEQLETARLAHPLARFRSSRSGGLRGICTSSSRSHVVRGGLMGKSATIDAGQEQHLQALEYANRVRLARARMKRRVAAGELSAAEVILSCPWQAHSMSVSDLLMSQKRWGRARCRRLLVSLGVPEN